jgi:hypothetical protein
MRSHQRTLQVKLCSQCGPSSHHVQTRNQFPFLPTEEVSDTFLCCLLKEQRSQNSPSRHCAPDASLQRMQRISVHCVWVFSLRSQLWRYSHLHTFWSNGVSSGLATRMTLTRVSRGRLGESVTRGRSCFWFHFCAVVRDCCWVAFCTLSAQMPHYNYGGILQHWRETKFVSHVL